MKLTAAAERVLRARVDNPHATTDELAEIIGYRSGTAVSYAIRCALNNNAVNSSRGPGRPMNETLQSRVDHPDAEPLRLQTREDSPTP